MILAIVQARMFSTRLPGKVMKEVLGKPLIGYLLERLACSIRIDRIIVATSAKKGNDEMCKYIKSKGLDVYRGSEDDVLGRFYHTAAKHNPKSIVRITGDCPLIDPEICDQVINIYLKEKADYVYLGPTFAEGLDCEIFSFPALKVAYKNAKMKSEREHVTLYFHNHPELFNIIAVKNETDDSKYRFTVDEPKDFEVIKAIIEALYKRNSVPFHFKEIKQFLDDHPDIFQKNAYIIRNEGLLKSLRADKEVK